MSDEPTIQRGGKAARNERRKAAAATINAVSVAIVIALILQPVALNRTTPLPAILFATAVFVVLQALAHYILDRLED